MKFGTSFFTYSGLLQSHRITLHDAIDHAASIGNDGVEFVAEQHLPNWPYTSMNECQDLRGYVESKGMEIGALSTYLSEMLRTDRLATTEELIETAKRHILFAKALGAAVWRPVTFFPLDQVLEVFTAVAPFAEANGVVCVLEVTAPYPTDYYNEVVEAIGSQHVKVLVDFSIWETSGLPGEFSSAPLSEIHKALPHLGHIHAKAHFFDEDGDVPNAPYEGLLKAVKDSGYDGWVMTEFEGWMLAEVDCLAAAETHLNVIKRYGR